VSLYKALKKISQPVSVLEVIASKVHNDYQQHQLYRGVKYKEGSAIR